VAQSRPGCHISLTTRCFAPASAMTLPAGWEHTHRLHKNFRGWDARAENVGVLYASRNGVAISTRSVSRR
jgi:hypothetical protein